MRFSMIILLVTMLAACKVKEPTANTKAAPNPDPATTVAKGPAGNGTLVQAMVVAIDSTLDKLDPDSPCGKYPCRALIRVERVNRLDPEWGDFFKPGKEVNINFGFTLAPTTDTMFPDLAQHYPGLSQGDRFEASVKTKLRSMNNLTHTVFHYQKID